MDDDEKRAIRADFAEAVNMAPAAIEKWLETEDSKRVGWKGDDGKGGGESVGHAEGRRIVEVKRTRQDYMTDDDYKHMKKVVGYIRRHMAQGPAKDRETSDWRYSLMNWGHDPCE